MERALGLSSQHCIPNCEKRRTCTQKLINKAADISQSNMSQAGHQSLEIGRLSNTAADESTCSPVADAFRKKFVGPAGQKNQRCMRSRNSTLKRKSCKTVKIVHSRDNGPMSLALIGHRLAEVHFSFSQHKKIRDIPVGGSITHPTMKQGRLLRTSVSHPISKYRSYNQDLQ